MRKPSRTCSLSAPPPTSRKLAGSPPWYLIRSIVLMASPAPLTRQAMSPSRLTYESPVRGTQLGRVFLGLVERGRDVGMAEHGVVVEVELAIKGQHVAAFGHDQRIDLGQRCVFGDEEFDEVLEEHGPLLGRRAESPSALQTLRA